VNQTIYILNGPNLNLLGKREPEIYGRETLQDVADRCRTLATELKLAIEFRQTNSEGGMVDFIHEAREKAAGIIVNAAAYTHTSIAILDALKACQIPIMEVHISNVHQRESFRHHSYVSLAASGVIVGCGTQGYLLALQRLATLVSAV
jgi:3-dehydroquinate dehydratase-2